MSSSRKWWSCKQTRTCCLQGGQLNMAVCFWYIVKIDLSSVHVYSTYTEKVTFYKVTEKTQSCITGHPVLYQGEGSNSRPFKDLPPTLDYFAPHPAGCPWRNKFLHFINLISSFGKESSYVVPKYM